MAEPGERGREDTVQVHASGCRYLKVLIQYSWHVKPQGSTLGRLRTVEGGRAYQGHGQYSDSARQRSTGAKDIQTPPR